MIIIEHTPRNTISILITQQWWILFLLTEEQVPEKVDVITSDASFISLKLVVPAALPFLKKGGRILALIKPQFEVGKGKVGKGGVVKDPAVHEEVIETLTQFFEDLGLQKDAVIPSPILGPKGNREFIISLKYGAACTIS